ncbi:MAG: hypothetical protein ACKVU1_05205 [bacterium]
MAEDAIGAHGVTPSDERIWERGWDGHERAQRERMARLPLWEKIAWLEEAQRVARALGARHAPAADAPDGRASE